MLDIFDPTIYPKPIDLQQATPFPLQYCFLYVRQFCKYIFGGSFRCSLEVFFLELIDSSAWLAIFWFPFRFDWLIRLNSFKSFHILCRLFVSLHGFVLMSNGVWNKWHIDMSCPVFNFWLVVITKQKTNYYQLFEAFKIDKLTKFEVRVAELRLKNSLREIVMHNRSWTRVC